MFYKIGLGAISPKPSQIEKTRKSVGANAPSALYKHVIVVLKKTFNLLNALGRLQVPSFSFSYLNSAIDWQFKTEPEPVACQGYAEQRCSWPRGKVLGGTSVINGMMFMRGTRKDYQRWADAGNPDWSYDKVLVWQAQPGFLHKSIADSGRL